MNRCHASFRVVTARQIKRLDQFAIEEIGIPSLVLMENAGQAVAGEIIQRFPRKTKINIFCGIGHNGGDGFVTARYLSQHGKRVQVFLIGKANTLKNDSLVNYKILKRLGFSIKEIGINWKFSKERVSNSLIVDAIFGVGLNRMIQQPFQGIIEKLNAFKQPIICIDVPSGLDATTGRIYGAAVKAHTTVTFTLAKKGFYQKEGPRHVGRIVVVDIGIPKKLYQTL